MTARNEEVSGKRIRKVDFLDAIDLLSRMEKRLSGLEFGKPLGSEPGDLRLGAGRIGDFAAEAGLVVLERGRGAAHRARDHDHGKSDLEHRPDHGKPRLVHFGHLKTSFFAVTRILS